MHKYLAKIPRVLVMIAPTSQKVLREKTLGIMRYAHLHGPWEIQFVDESPLVPGVGALENWRPDGIITRESPEALAALGFRAARVPTVYLDAELRGRSGLPVVQHNVREAAEAVADCFVGAGLERFAYVGAALAPEPFWSSERGEAFAARLRARGLSCEVYAPERATDWGLEQRRLREWLRALPKPCGLFVAFDLQARQVLDTCLTAGIRVPDEVAVISVDNDELICENTEPSLSSVQSDFEGGGYLAAELLDRLMRRKARKPARLAYGFRRIVHRQSSQFREKTSWLIGKAEEFIRLNAGEGVSVPEVARHLRVSRSTLDKRFRRELGHSVLSAIQRQRLERLCVLLRETALPIGKAGERCGYVTEAYLKRLFKRTFGMTMREYRARHSRG